MSYRGGYDTHGVNVFGDFFHRRKRFDAESFRSGFGGVGENVINADQFNAFDVFVGFQMVFAHHASADNRYFNRVIHVD